MHPSRRRATRAFTLIELLIATTLGAMIMVATAMSTGLFAQTVAHFEDDGVDELDVALARIASDVRYAWWADMPTRQSLRICDADGDVTTYALEGDELVVKLPSGTEGVLAGGLSGVLFEGNHARRLREGPTSVRSGTVYEETRPASGLQTLEMNSGAQVALAFTLSESDGPGDVADIHEHLLNSTVETLRLGVAVASGVVGTMSFEIYEAAAHGDARPRSGAAALASSSIAITSLPAASVDVGRFADRFGNVTLCHNGSTVSVSVATVALHLLHGDTLGSCSSPLSKYGPPAVETSLNLSFSGVRLRPGIGYTLVVTMSGSGSVSVLAGKVKSPAWDVVSRPSSGSAYAPLDMSIPFRITGERVVTTTVESEVVSAVAMTLTGPGGVVRGGSAAVTSQVVAQDPWMGVVPGEAPPAP